MDAYSWCRQILLQSKHEQVAIIKDEPTWSFDLRVIARNKAVDSIKKRGQTTIQGVARSRGEMSEIDHAILYGIDLAKERR